MYMRQLLRRRGEARGRKLEAEARTRQQKNCLEVPQGKAIASRTTSLLADDLIICPMLCYSNGTDNEKKLNAALPH